MEIFMNCGDIYENKIFHGFNVIQYGVPVESKSHTMLSHNFYESYIIGILI